MSNDIQENRVRRMARRQGLRLVKSRRRDPRALDYGLYTLVDIESNATVGGGHLHIDQAEAYLKGVGWWAAPLSEVE